jgi:hypothetical protein
MMLRFVVFGLFGAALASAALAQDLKDCAPNSEKYDVCAAARSIQQHLAPTLPMRVIGAHVNVLHAIGGVPNAIVCDNLKAGVTASCRYEPGINRTYQEFAEHYGTAILPAHVVVQA